VLLLMGCCRGVFQESQVSAAAAAAAAAAAVGLQLAVIAWEPCAVQGDCQHRLLLLPRALAPVPSAAAGGGGYVQTPPSLVVIHRLLLLLLVVVLMPAVGVPRQAANGARLCLCRQRLCCAVAHLPHAAC
jgi:hypothetical protein